jgi:hypothetical protein
MLTEVVMSDEDSLLFISSSKEPRRYGGMHIAIWNEKITRLW